MPADRPSSLGEVAELRVNERGEPVPFVYYLNQMERAAQEMNPADHDYAGKRKQVLDHVVELYAVVSQQQATTRELLEHDPVEALVDALRGMRLSDADRWALIPIVARLSDLRLRALSSGAPGTGGSQT